MEREQAERSLLIGPLPRETPIHKKEVDIVSESDSKKGKQLLSEAQSLRS